MITKKSAKPVRTPAGQNPVRARILEAAFSAFMERGFAKTSTLEIATRARASKRELYIEFDSKQDVLVACIGERAKRLKLPVDLPRLQDRADLERTLVAFGSQLLREITDPTVVAVFRLAIAEAVRAPEVARTLNAIGAEPSRAALRELMNRARSAGLLSGEPTEMAEHFAGLLWGNLMTGLLLRVVERPNPREVARRARVATAALLQLYARPDRA
jgi:AcrR family transcriptional regulator